MANANPTSPAHSPGPWAYSKQERSFDQDFDGTYKPFLIRDEGSRLNFAALLDTHCGTEANARLIASAPALLDRCKMSLQDAKDALSGDWVPTAEGWQSIIDDLERIIAEAESR